MFGLNPNVFYNYTTGVVDNVGIKKRKFVVNMLRIKRRNGPRKDRTVLRKPSLNQIAVTDRNPVLVPCFRY